MNISTVFTLLGEIYARLSQYFAQNRPIVALNIVGVVLGADAQLVAALIVLKALEAPLRQIAQNAGLEGSVIADKLKTIGKTNYGFNAQTEEYVDMIEAGRVAEWLSNEAEKYKIGT